MVLFCTERAFEPAPQHGEAMKLKQPKTIQRLRLSLFATATFAKSSYLNEFGKRGTHIPIMGLYLSWLGECQN